MDILSSLQFVQDLRQIVFLLLLFAICDFKTPEFLAYYWLNSVEIFWLATSSPNLSGDSAHAAPLVWLPHFWSKHQLCLCNAQKRGWEKNTGPHRILSSSEAPIMASILPSSEDDPIKISVSPLKSSWVSVSSDLIICLNYWQMYELNRRWSAELTYRDMGRRIILFSFFFFFLGTLLFSTADIDTTPWFITSLRQMYSSPLVQNDLSPWKPLKLGPHKTKGAVWRPS